MVDFNQKLKEERDKCMKKLDKQTQQSEQDQKEAAAFDAKDSTDASKFHAAGDINTETEGVEVGLINTEKFNFENIGDRLYGYLKCRARRTKGKDDFMVIEVYNANGDWSYFPSDLVEGRLSEIDDKCIIDITYIGDKMSTSRGQNYKDYRVKWYPWPENVDPYAVRVTLKPDRKTLTFIDYPSDLGEKPKEPVVNEDGNSEG
jgi:hypothetical protein